MRTVAFFNNKGGVGKTTLACNFAAYLHSAARHRVLLIDLDPQCNSTQLLLDEDVWEGIYSDPAVAASKTTLSLFKNIINGDSALNLDDLPFTNTGRFGISLLPGSPRLSNLEDEFGSSWVAFPGGKAAPVRRTTWLRAFARHLTDQFDTVVIDVSPSLGALNRSCLIGSDFFVTPMAPDLFSLFALDNISSWFKEWVKQYRFGYMSASGDFPELLPEHLPIEKGFLGYTVQQYVTRSQGQGQRRRVLAYDRHRKEIPRRAEGMSTLSPFEARDLDLGTVPNMFAMVPLAQSAHAPVADLTKEDGIRGAQFSQHERYVEQLNAIFARLRNRLDGSAGAEVA